MWRAQIESLLDEVLRTHGTLVIHFWASWNASDRRMEEILQQIVPEFAGRVQFYSCDVDAPENRSLCERCGVANVPYLGVFVDGRVSPGIMGLRTVENLASEIDDRLSRRPPTP